MWDDAVGLYLFWEVLFSSVKCIYRNVRQADAFLPEERGCDGSVRV